MQELESLFFVFTTEEDVATWQVFHQYDPKDSVTLGELRLRINQRIDRMLKDQVPENRRFYFRHSRQGLYSLPADARPSWENVKGIIADLGGTKASAEHTTALVMTLTALAEKASSYARTRTRILSCFIPSNSDPPAVAFKLGVIRVRLPEDSKQLEEAITAWLMDVSFDAMRDLTGDNAELHEKADEYVQSCLLKRAKAGHSR
jgi:hypothetical protein